MSIDDPRDQMLVLDNSYDSFRQQVRMDFFLGTILPAEKEKRLSKKLTQTYVEKNTKIAYLCVFLPKPDL